MVSVSGTRFTPIAMNFNRLNIYNNSSEQGTRLALQLSAPADLEVKREANKVYFFLGNLPIDPSKEDYQFKDSFISSVIFEDLPVGSQITVQLTDARWQTKMTRLASQNVYLLEIAKPPAGKSAAAEASAGIQERVRRRGRGRHIVLDPGHGGKDSGVRIAENLYEKDLVLLLARKIRAQLQNKLGAEVMLTRNTDQSLTLDERIDAANRAQTDLFISLHVGNSNQPIESKSYVYIYKMGGASLDEEAHAGSPGTLPTPSLFLPWDQAQLKSLERSAQLAEILQAELNHQLNGGDASVVYRHAPLRVLSALAMPAVLVELGNARFPEFKQIVNLSAYQESVVLAIWAALDKYRNQVEKP
jgi:N-acetylmuramoyl-L-alanine amidase